MAVPKSFIRDKYQRPVLGHNPFHFELLPIACPDFGYGNGRDSLLFAQTFTVALQTPEEQCSNAFHV